MMRFSIRSQTWACYHLLCLSAASVAGLDLLPADYDPHIQPRGPDGGPVTVYLSMIISGINEIDERDMTVVIEVYFRILWKDSRLSFPEDLFNGTQDGVPVSYTIINDLNLWRPDPFIERVHRINSASLIQPFGGVQLLRDGRIFWGQMFVIKLGCPMFFHDFPFDVQVCKLEMASYFHSIVDMSFAWYGNGITASSDIQKLPANYEFVRAGERHFLHHHRLRLG
ncbi:gamma-aminobutyric acid receptor alpha-like [Penaeus japonicus]|uniref:gamma-aminobutyric acid receptor alpha-like n=1 Tax=Penaeus japonicus TaxID=27405 RepID=UPI001C716D31|nr:gamma-aminobutyric acid receptor alpha-like [Penaeus japonicus]